MSSHICDAIVVACIDFRFQRHIRDWTDTNLQNKTFDMVGFAGSTKEVETVMKQIEISIKLHQIKQIVLVHHEECGAYGEESTPERHAQDLNIARATIISRYSDIAIDMYYLHLDGTFEKVKPLTFDTQEVSADHHQRV